MKEEEFLTRLMENQEIGGYTGPGKYILFGEQVLLIDQYRLKNPAFDCYQVEIVGKDGKTDVHFSYDSVKAVEWAEDGSMVFIRVKDSNGERIIRIPFSSWEDGRVIVDKV